MPIGPYDIAPSLEWRRRRGSLLSSVEVIERVGDVRWEAGLMYMPAGRCGRPGRWVACVDDVKQLNPSVIDSFHTPRFVPFVVVGEYDCSTASGMDLNEFQTEASNVLERGLSYQIEREFLTGDLTLWVDSDAVYLAHPNTQIVTRSTQSPECALMLLQNMWADCAGDINGVFHASPGIVQIWQHYGFVQSDSGGVLRDMFGNIVVAGSGYVGSVGPRMHAAYSVVVDATSGLFGLIVVNPFDGLPVGTAALAHNASEGDVEAAIEQLGWWAACAVTKNQVGNVHTWNVVFDYPVDFTLAGQDLGLAGGLGISVTQTGVGGPMLVGMKEGKEWVYATGPVRVWLSDLRFDVPDRIADGMVRGTNDVVVRAERTALVQVDSCCMLAVPVAACITVGKTDTIIGDLS